MPKPELEFFKPDHIPWTPVAGSATGGAVGAGVTQKILSRNEEGDVTRLLQFDALDTVSGQDRYPHALEVVSHVSPPASCRRAACPGWPAQVGPGQAAGPAQAGQAAGDRVTLVQPWSRASKCW